MSSDSADAVPEWVLDRITDEGVLNLSGEDLGGEIPAWVWQLIDLRGLDLSVCRLAGAIPPELSQLTNLATLRLDGNQLSGAIPPELGQLTNLATLRLDGNQLSGAIPPELGQLTNLTVLRLDLGQTDDKLSRAQQQLVTRSTSRLDGEIAEMIAGGESTTVEFRAILRGSRGDRKPERAVLKSIAAFLNTNGGTLVIGVDDHGNPLGLDNDGFPDEDRMALHLSNLVSARLGAGVWGNVDIEFASYQGRRILVIRCTKSSNPIFVGEDDEFYVRAGPATRRLTLREAVDHIRTRS